MCKEVVYNYARPLFTLNKKKKFTINNKKYRVSEIKKNLST